MIKQELYLSRLDKIWRYLKMHASSLLIWLSEFTEVDD